MTKNRSGSLATSMSADPNHLLGRFLTFHEASGLAAALADRRHISDALGAVQSGRRPEAAELMAASGLGHLDPDRSVAVLNAIAGAKTAVNEITPVWTMPGDEAEIGHLTSQFETLVRGARQSVTCATYNFQDSSNMWTVLREVAAKPGSSVTVYIDGQTSDGATVEEQLRPANVYRSGVLPNGKNIVSHAKFTVVDHTMVLLTSANFSYSAENSNIELGLLINDPALATSIEEAMAAKQKTLYEKVA